MADRRIVFDPMVPYGTTWGSADGPVAHHIYTVEQERDRYREVLEWIAQMGPTNGAKDSRLHPSYAPLAARAALDGREIINPTKETGEHRANDLAPDHEE